MNLGLNSKYFKKPLCYLAQKYFEMNQKFINFVYKIQVKKSEKHYPNFCNFT